jgi:hypothetical protein
MGCEKVKSGTINVIACIFVILIVIISGCIEDDSNKKNDIKKNHPPLILNFEVRNSWPTGYDILWNITDQDMDNLTITLYYSFDNQTTWIHIDTFNFTEGQTWWDFPDTGKKEEFVIKIFASDLEDTVQNISEKYIAYPMTHRYSYSIEINPESSEWNLLYLPTIILSNNSISKINEKIVSESFSIIETPHGPAFEINTSSYLHLSGEIILTKLDSEFGSDHLLSMFTAYDSHRVIDTKNFTDEFRKYNREVGQVWVYYNNSYGYGNISIKLEFGFSGFGAIYKATWGEISVGWQEREIYECEYVV